MDEKLTHDKWSIWYWIGNQQTFLPHICMNLLVWGDIWIELCLKTLQVSKELNNMKTFQVSKELNKIR